MLDKCFFEIRESFKKKNTIKIKDQLKYLFPKLYEAQYLYDRTYYHPLGFIYCKLFEFPNKETLRFHVWGRERRFQQPLMIVHNHLYIVNSFVIVGEMCNKVYSTEDKSDPNFAIYKSQYGANNERYLYKTENNIRVLSTKEEIIKNGVFYRIGTEVLHSSYVNENEFTATLVFTEAPGISNPIVLGPINGEQEYHYETVQVERFKIDMLLDNVITSTLSF